MCDAGALPERVREVHAAPGRGDGVAKEVMGGCYERCGWLMNIRFTSEDNHEARRHGSMGVEAVIGVSASVPSVWCFSQEERTGLGVGVPGVWTSGERGVRVTVWRPQGVETPRWRLYLRRGVRQGAECGSV